MPEDNQLSYVIDSLNQFVGNQRDANTSLVSSLNTLGDIQLEGFDDVTQNISSAISSIDLSELGNLQLESFASLDDSFSELQLALNNSNTDDSIRVAIDQLSNDQIELFSEITDSFTNLNETLARMEENQVEIFTNIGNSIIQVPEAIRAIPPTPPPPPPTPAEIEPQVNSFDTLLSELQESNRIAETEKRRNELAEKVQERIAANGNNLTIEQLAVLNELNEDLLTIDVRRADEVAALFKQSEGILKELKNPEESIQEDPLLKELRTMNETASRESERQRQIETIQKKLLSSSESLSAEQIEKLNALSNDLRNVDMSNVEASKALIEQSKAITEQLDKLADNEKEEDPLLASLNAQREELKLENARQAKIAELNAILTKQSNSLSAEQIAQFQSLKDSLESDDLQNAENRKEEIARAEETINALKGIEDATNEAAERQFRESKVGKGLGILEQFFPGLPVGKIGKIAQSIMNFRTAVLPGLISGFRGLMVGLRSLAIPLTILIATFEGIRGFIKGFVKQEGNILQKIIRGLSTAVGQILSTLVGLPINLLKGALAWLLDKFGFGEAAEILRSFDAAKEIFNFFDKLGEKLANVLKPFTEFIMEYFAIVGKLFKGLFESIKNIFKNVLGVISGVIIFLKGLFTGDTDAMGRGLMQIFESMFGYFKEIFKIPYKIADYIKDAVALLLSKIGFGGLAEKLKSISFAETFENVANTIFGLITDIFDFIKGIFTGEIDIVGLFNGLLSKAMDTLKNMRDTFANLIKAIAAGSGAAIKAALPGGQSPQEAFMETFSAVMAGGQTPAQKKESYEANIERLAEVDEKLAGGNEEIESLDSRIANVKERMAAGETTNTFGESYEDILGSLKEMRKAEVAENVALSKEQFTLLTDAANYEEEMARKEITDLQQKIDEEKALLAEEGDEKTGVWGFRKLRSERIAELEEEMAGLQFQPIIPMSQTTGATMEATVNDTAAARDEATMNAQAALSYSSQPTTNNTTQNTVTYNQTAHVDDTSVRMYQNMGPGFIM